MMGKKTGLENYFGKKKTNTLGLKKTKHLFFPCRKWGSQSIQGTFVHINDT